MTSTAFKLALLVGVALLFILALGVLRFVGRKRRAASSKFGFTPERQKLAEPVALPPVAKQDETLIKTERFIQKRGQRIVEVLVDYATVKGLKSGVYVARPYPNSCVWWIGDKHPSAPKTVVAAVHVGIGTVNGFRSKVVVLSDASEADALARALGRAARPRATPTRSDAWNVPISFPGFPIRAGDGAEITELRAPPQHTDLTGTSVDRRGPG
jgi:hypothetical protein